MKKTQKKSLKDFAKKSTPIKNLKKIKGGTDGDGDIVIDGTAQIVTEDIMM